MRRAEVKLMGVGFPEQLHFGGPVLGEYDFSDLGQVGPPLVHKFLVINNGPSMLDVLSLHIQWPYQVENGHKSGKWLFYSTLQKKAAEVPKKQTIRQKYRDT